MRTVEQSIHCFQEYTEPYLKFWKTTALHISEESLFMRGNYVNARIYKSIHSWSMHAFAYTHLRQ